jgi:hypothetical protein
VLLLDLRFGRGFTFNRAKTVFYFGMDDEAFNVGRFVQVANNRWDDWALIRVPTAPVAPVSFLDIPPRPIIITIMKLFGRSRINSSSRGRIRKDKMSQSR